jgi:hypothetical protein
MSGYRIEANVFVKDTGIYGKSLFAARPFERGELVFAAFGPIVTVPNRYTIPIDWNLYIEPRIPVDNLCQYICHSCEPNLGIKNRSMFVAMQDIAKDEEVAVDYGMFVYESPPHFPEEGRTCKCGRKMCRGLIGAFTAFSPELREKYAGYISDFLLGKPQKIHFPDSFC